MAQFYFCKTDTLLRTWTPQTETWLTGMGANKKTDERTISRAISAHPAINPDRSAGQRNSARKIFRDMLFVFRILSILALYGMGAAVT
jgi:hypothetical protein